MRLWQAPGCHEFLASLGFDLLDVGKDEVTVKAGKQANRRILQFGLQALVAIFGNNLHTDSILKFVHYRVCSDYSGFSLNLEHFGKVGTLLFGCE